MSVSSPCFLLVDDHALFRTGLALMLPQTWPEARVIQAASWGETLLALQRETPDLIMLDVHLPDGHGLADLAVLRARAPATPVLLMSAEVELAAVQQARDAGAAGFLPKSAAAGEVMSAVAAALRGDVAFAAVPYNVKPSAATTAMPPLPQTWGAQESLAHLSDRQRDILQYLGRGTPNKAIARQMGMTESEVRAEVSWLTECLGASSREEAYARAVSRGLVRP
ncbi:MAG: response regulator transcription factor [Aquabacterium sp.]